MKWQKTIRSENEKLKENNQKLQIQVLKQTLQDLKAGL